MPSWPRALALLALATLASACVVTTGGGPSFVYGSLDAEARTQIDRPLEIQPGGRLTVDVPVGSVTVRASEGPASVHATLRARAETQAEADAALSRVELVVRAVEGGARVEVRTPDKNDTTWYASADLEIALPPRCALDVGTGTGEVRCDHGPYGAAELRSTYGAIVASDVQGGLRARSGSGAVRAARVHGGAVELKSGYGDVALEDGEADSVELSSGSGKVEAQRVKAARIDLSTTYGRATLREAQGEARAKSGSGEVRAEQWRGTKLTLESGYGAVTARDTVGDLELKSGSGNVVAESGEGAVRAHTTYGAVRVEGILRDIELESGSGAVSATARLGSSIGSGWSLKSGYGGVTLTVPDPLSFDLDARTTHGRIELGLPIEVPPGALKERAVAGKVRGGGGRVSLVTGSGNVRLAPGP